MTKPTYESVRQEQALEVRTTRQKALVSTQRNVESYIASRQNAVEIAEKNLAAAQERLELAKANKAEIETNVTEFVKRVEALGNQDVIEHKELVDIQNESYTLNRTKAEIEQAEKQAEVARSAYAARYGIRNTVYEDMYPAVPNLGGVVYSQIKNRNTR